MRLLYSLAIFLYKYLVLLFSLWNPKAKKKYLGSTNWGVSLREFSKNNPNVVWFHASSLGEFEQGRPLIEKIKTEKPESKILLTFFSPSGYEIQKEYTKADHVCYLPFDLVSECKKFIQIAQPSLVVFVKYDYWYNLMNELGKSRIPFVYISAHFQPNQYFFTFLGGWFLKHLKMADCFFVQDETSQKILSDYNIKAIVSGDTRIDRVKDIANNILPIPIVEKFKGSNTILIAGSTWKKDNKILIDIINKSNNSDIKYIIAPHEIDENQIVALQKAIQKNTLRYTQINKDKGIPFDVNVIILDTVGLLSSVYQYGDVAYIGGGFDDGIHNILEPAVFGIPIVFGPNHTKFIEAIALVEQKGALTGKNEIDLKKELKSLIEDKPKRLQLGIKTHDYIWNKETTIEIIYNFIRKYL